MGECDIAAEVLDGLHEIREHRAGKRALRETRVEAKPLAELAPGMADRIRENLDGSESRFPGVRGTSCKLSSER